MDEVKAPPAAMPTTAMDPKIREFYDGQMNFLMNSARGLRCGLFLLSLDAGAIPEKSSWAKFLYEELLAAAASINKFLPPEEGSKQ